jgi:hypothetical protein
MSSDDEYVERMVKRMLDSGVSKAAVIADAIIDGGAGTGGKGVIDRMKAAGRLGLYDVNVPDYMRSWVRAELIHAVVYGFRYGGMTKEELLAEMASAIDEVRNAP